ncbi:hypothetical protein CVT26_003758 [Gymnopilus dilepis]|uniref:F-box domain-containing protein n=1 Tax=Gymnopilus dilepis TaxID=231916 RepID=A0A409VS31_9AGAR|nr:hypothetical protein CVT26_003758 [Gymnopilus dilepis]
MDSAIISPRQCFIGRLSDDVLWAIFSLNADMDVRSLSHRRLTRNLPFTSSLDTTINSSQVCQSWRRTILRSPSIWGRVLRVDRVNQLGKIWGEEIIRRAANAALCAYGDIWGARANDVAFLETLFRGHWERIQRVDLAFGDVAFYYHLESELWKVLSRPAPRLESFSLTVMGAHTRGPPLPENGLFAGDAPSLKEVSTVNTLFAMNTPQKSICDLKGLLHLRLDSSEHEVVDILDAIKELPHLEELVLGSMACSDPSLLPDREDSICLPHLTKLYFTDSLRAAIPVALAILPSYRCALLWHSISEPSISDQKSINAICRILTRYYGSYFAATSTSANAISLVINHEDFRFSCTTMDDLPSSYRPLNIAELSSPSDFSLDFSCHFPQGAISSFLSHLSEADSSKITYLSFEVSFYSVLNKNRLGLSAFLKSLTSVETLEAWGKSLTILQNLKDPILPSLRTWRLPHILTTVDAVCAFLDSRRRLNHPISVLKILFERPMGDWRRLEEFVDLRVVWKVDSVEKMYICGNGNANKLWFWYVIVV